MNLAPIGVFALISYTFSNFGWKIIFSLSKFLLLNYFVFAFHALITYSIMFKILTKLSIKKLWHKFLPTASVAFSTASSSATLPVAIKAANNLGVSNEISAFGLSLGSTINMNGTAIMQGITTIFLSHIYKIDLNTTDLIKIIAVSVISAIGTAGVPGAGILMLSMVLKTANIPVEGIGLIIGVDRIIDAGRTLVNVMGDVICTVIVAKLENDLDEKKFNN
jgi:Na+/H+-dicarboxylate symporter